GRPVVVAGFTVEPLALVAAMIDTPSASGACERLVRQLGPVFASVVAPVPSVKIAALGRPAALRTLRIGSSKPLLARSLETVVPSLGQHQVRMRVVRVAVPV